MSQHPPWSTPRMLLNMFSSPSAWDTRQPLPRNLCPSLAPRFTPNRGCEMKPLLFTQCVGRLATTSNGQHAQYKDTPTACVSNIMRELLIAQDLKMYLATRSLQSESKDKQHFADYVSVLTRRVESSLTNASSGCQRLACHIHITSDLLHNEVYRPIIAKIQMHRLHSIQHNLSEYASEGNSGGQFNRCVPMYPTLSVAAG
jgi:hypothetical protein